MKKEISPDLFIVDALYYVKGKQPLLSLNSKDSKYFWRYVFLADKEIRKQFKEIIMYSDKNSLENVIYNKGWAIKIKDNKLKIDYRINKERIEEINKSLDPEVKKALPKIFKNAYEMTQII